MTLLKTRGGYQESFTLVTGVTEGRYRTGFINNINIILDAYLLPCQWIRDFPPTSFFHSMKSA